MAAFSADDLLAALATDGIGTAVTIGGSDYNALFRAPATGVSLGDLEVISAQPGLRMRVIDITAAGLVEGTVITIDGDSYGVTEAPRSDSNGLAELTLRAL